LINNLFDVNHLGDNGPKTKYKFLKSRKIIRENGENLWNDFESSLLTCRQKLDLDAVAAESDPAAKV
jgi:hypothetical protein